MVMWLQKKDWERPRKPSIAVLDVTFDILFFRPIESMMKYQLVSLYVVATIIEQMISLLMFED